MSYFVAGVTYKCNTKDIYVKVLLATESSIFFRIVGGKDVEIVGHEGIWRDIETARDSWHPKEMPMVHQCVRKVYWSTDVREVKTCQASTLLSPRDHFLGSLKFSYEHGQPLKVKVLEGDIKIENRSGK